MHCGGPLLVPTQHAVSAEPIPASFQDATARNRRSTRWAVVLGLLGALLAAWIGLKASGALGLGGQQAQANSLQASGSGNPPVLEAQGSNQPPILRAEGNSGSPVLERAGQVVVMPDDIRAWLEHLRRTEEKRMRLAENQISEMMVSLTLLQGGDPLSNLGGLLNEDDPIDSNAKPPSIEKTTNDTLRQRKAWTELTTFFNSVPPPAECAPIRNEYDQVVRETGAMMADIVGVVADAGSNPQSALASLMRMQGKSKDRVDKPAAETDGLVGEICRKYNTRKWFDIQGDVGGGMFGKNKIF